MCSSDLAQRKQPWWYCPACRKYSDQKGWGQPDYGANETLFANRTADDRDAQGPDSGIPLNAIFTVVNASETIAVIDVGSAGNPLLHKQWGFLDRGKFINQSIPDTASQTTDAGIAFRHPASESLKGSSCNMLFADLHVESVSHEDPRLQTQSGRRKLLSISE